MNFGQKEGGFTLIEMLVVVAVIGLLSSAVLVGLNDARQRARDSRRISDLRQIQNGLEIFYNGNGFYPQKVYENSKIKQQLPRDPQGGKYDYHRQTPQFYVLGACLEKSKPAGVEGYDGDVEIEIEDSPLTPPPKCNCSDETGYCVSIGGNGGSAE